MELKASGSENLHIPAGGSVRGEDLDLIPAAERTDDDELPHGKGSIFGIYRRSHGQSRFLHARGNKIATRVKEGEGAIRVFISRTVAKSDTGLAIVRKQGKASLSLAANFKGGG